MDGSLGIVGLIAFVIASASFPVVVSYFLDRRVHEGVDWFKRRRVRSSGQPAEATILSRSMLIGRTTGSKFSAAHSIVYEVRPNGQPPFRTRAVEVLYHSETYGNRYDEGQVVSVRFDPRDQTTVLERVDLDKERRDKEAERKAKEEALLKG